MACVCCFWALSLSFCEGTWAGELVASGSRGAARTFGTRLARDFDLGVFSLAVVTLLSRVIIIH